MIDQRLPKFEWGQPVRAVDDLFNDGSYPDAEDGALLAAAGSLGEIVQIGHHTEANIPIYMVEFDGKVLGCLEEELMHADAAETVAASPEAA
jgi:nitrogen fixation protein NifZ